MAEKKIYTVTDLGPGDGGKGGVVHKLSHMKRAHTILKVGGAQGSHGVRTSRGDGFAFSQYGCGTFEGVRTHLTKRMIVSPEGLLNESDALCYGRGLRDVFSFLTIDENAICATPFHAVVSHLKELARGNNPRGTIGSGVGEAYRYAEWYPELTIRACNLHDSNLRDLLAAVRDRTIANMQEIVGQEFLPNDRLQVEEEIALLNDPNFLDHILMCFQEVPKRFKIVDADYMRREILGRDGVVVVESSHGILTDHFQGFHPHTSAIRTLPCFTQDMLRDAMYDGEIVNLAVTRAYQIRHGAGPMPTADPEMSECLLPGSSKKENRYQGKVRVGSLDLVLLRYAIACAGGPSAFHGLAVTWFDQIQKNGSWKICDRYADTSNTKFFSPLGDLNLRFGADEAQLQYQQELGQELQNSLPRTSEFSIPDTNREKLFDWCREILEDKLGLNVRMVSFGPTERDKICK